MSGNFDYIQNEFDQLIGELQDLTESHYSEVTIHEFEKALELTIILKSLVDRIDYLVSGEETEESFHQELDDLDLCINLDEIKELQF